MWLAIAAVGLGSYLLRVIPLVVLPRMSVSPRFDRAVRHAGLAAITALLVASVCSPTNGDLGPTLVATLIAAVLAFRGLPMVLVVSIGGLAYAAIMLAAS
jgi:branched-subunit amino acid transport protein